MEKLPIEIIIKIMIFLGNNNDIENTKLIMKNDHHNYIIDNIIEYIFSKSVKKYENGLLVEITPRRKLSLSVNNSFDVNRFLKKIFFVDTNDYLTEWIKNFENEHL